MPLFVNLLLSCFLSHLDKLDAFFVGFCVIHRYWPVIVSFAPLYKQGYLLHHIAIATFCCIAQNTFVLRVFCAVQPKCHTDNVAWLLDLSGTSQEEILLPIHVGKFGLDLLLVNYLNSASWEVSTSLLSHDCAVCFHCCATCTVMFLDFSELHKWRQDFQSICAP